MFKQRSIAISKCLDHVVKHLGGPSDLFIELIAGFLYERCDNLLANVEDEGLRSLIVRLANELYELYLKAYASARGLEVEELVISDPSELDRCMESLRRALKSGYFELILTPREVRGLFFKDYYLPRNDVGKVRRILMGMKSVVNYLSTLKIDQRYRGRLEDVERALNRVIRLLPLIGS